MTRRSNKKTLYNNVLRSKPTKNKPAYRTEYIDSDSVFEVVFLNVYKTALSRIASFVLLLSFLIQPVFADAEELITEPGAADSQFVVEQEAQGSEEESVVEPDLTQSEDVLVEEVLEPEPEIESETDFDTDESENETPNESVATELDHTAESDLGTTSAEQVDEQNQESDDLPVAENSTTDSDLQNTASSTVSGTQGVSSSTDEVVADEGGGQDDSVEQNNTDEPDVGGSSDSTSDSTAEDELSATTTTTTTAPEIPVQAVSIVQTTGEFSFNKSECTLVEDGSYYCQKNTAPAVQKDDLYAAPDSDGDLEIYLRRDSEDIQITDNKVDDASPFFDPKSNTIVWHRLINDRYQIVSYDVSDGDEEVITDTRVNNMEPSRSGDVTVWQRWVDNNWEVIMLHDDNEVQLTDSVEHDVAPSIRGQLVIWNVRASDGTHSLKTYDITSGVITDISDPDGVAVSNPRMVVVYDAVYENGDTVMKGVDLVTGEVIPLGQSPRDLPEKIPTPDTTGETRALINNSSPKPEQEDFDFEPDTSGASGPEPDPDPDTLDLSFATSSIATSTSEVEFDEYELDLRPATNTIEVPEQHDIEDLVIPAATSTATSTQNN